MFAEAKEGNVRLIVVDIQQGMLLVGVGGGGLRMSLQSQSKWLGHFGVSLSPQCWCTRFGDQTAINNFERDEGSTRREKTAFG